MEQARTLLDRKLEASPEQLLRMGELAESILEKSIRALNSRRPDLAQEVFEDDRAIDRLDLEIHQGVLELLALGAPVAHDLRQTIAIKTAALDCERVGDLARNIAESAVRLVAQGSIKTPLELQTLADATQRILSSALTAFADDDPRRAHQVVDSDDRIDKDEARVIRAAIQTMREKPRMTMACADFILIAKSLERVADHATNIDCRSRRDGHPIHQSEARREARRSN